MQNSPERDTISASKTMETIKFSFNLEKATQAAARFLKLNKGSMSYLGLIKLMYLADREALRRLERPISGDRYVSMKNGPVLSRVKNLITEEDETEDYWRQSISIPENYSVKLLEDPGNAELCEAEEEIIDQVFEQYGHLKPFKLADLTHEICDEWEKPQEDGPGSLPIPIERILEAVGKDDKDIQRIRSELKQDAILNVILK
jgi:uncharacterized phage-associated protein